MTYIDSMHSILIHGGKILSSDKEKYEMACDDLWAFNIPTYSWVEITGLQFKPRYNHQLINNQNELIIFGGENTEKFLDGEIIFLKLV